MKEEHVRIMRTDGVVLCEATTPALHADQGLTMHIVDQVDAAIAEGYATALQWLDEVGEWNTYRVWGPKGTLPWPTNE